MKRISFADIPVPNGALIILDIDGTLTLSGAREVPLPIAQKVRLLVRDNIVYLCSNKKKKDRDAAVAETLGVPWIDSVYRKPSVRVLASIPRHEREGKSMVVIGDKMLTDGLLAFALKAHFFFVERLEGPDTPFIDRLYYFIDDIATRVLAPFF